MKIGPLNKQVTLRSPSGDDDGYGQPSDAFTTFATVWASIEPISSKEIISAQEQSGSISHKIIIRYNASITGKDRVYYNSRIFELSAPPRNIKERNHYMELLCTEVET